MSEIVGIRTHYRGVDGKESLSAVDWWRIENPLRNSDFSVDFINKVVDEGQDPEIAWQKLGKYKVIYTSYIDTPKAYAWMRAVANQSGSMIIMDIDDDIFNVDEMNPAHLHYYPGSEALENARKIIEDVPLLVTSTPSLAASCARYREKPIVVLPNAIDPEVYRYDARKVEKHDGKIVIGYQGSATHYTDLFKTGVLFALQRLVHTYPEVHIHIVGCPIDEIARFFPEGRVTLAGGHRDHAKWVKLWQTLPFDIGIAPLIDSPFNQAKSSIKYFEYSLRKIPGVYSFVEPYLQVVQENNTGFLAQDEEEWYEKLSWLVENKKLRTLMGNNARRDVLEHHAIRTKIHLWNELLSQYC